MCMVAVPIMALSFYMILQSGAGDDGILGKEAYESAANIADETLSSMPTVVSFSGETKAAERYESHLGEAEDAAIRQVSFCIYKFLSFLALYSILTPCSTYYVPISQSKKLGLGTGFLWVRCVELNALLFYNLHTNFSYSSCAPIQLFFINRDRSLA